jgi:hypothetical protein
VLEAHNITPLHLGRVHRESPERWYSPLSNGEPSDSIDEFYSAITSLHSSLCTEDSSEASEYYNDLDGYLAIEQEMLARMNEKELLEMFWLITDNTPECNTQLTRPTKEHNTANGESEVGRARTIIRINNTRHWMCWPGRAIQQIVLLRRCFYPRRNVIKW